MKIVLIGAGNLATNLGKALISKNYSVQQVYSRTQQSACTLAQKLGCVYTSAIDEIVMDADLYIVALKDSVLDDLLPSLVRGRESALWVHTAGSISISIWQGCGLNRYGVFYPMQTFSKTREVDFTEIPCFLEACNEDDLMLLRNLAKSLSHKVYEADSQQRRYLHLSAVFACNFTNQMYSIASRLLEEHGLPFEVMLPLIDETARKVHTLKPVEAQTGPAIRYDKNVIDKHLALLDGHPLWSELYTLASRSIYEEKQSKQTEQ